MHSWSRTRNLVWGWVGVSCVWWLMAIAIAMGERRDIALVNPEQNTISIYTVVPEADSVFEFWSSP